MQNMSRHKANKHNMGERKIPNDGKRDKWGRVVRMCGIEGCSYKTGRTQSMDKHKARMHNIGEYVIKILNDGKERNKWGRIVRVCGIDGCSFKTGHSTAMKNHKARESTISAKIMFGRYLMMERRGTSGVKLSGCAG